MTNYLLHKHTCMCNTRQCVLYVSRTMCFLMSVEAQHVRFWLVGGLWSRATPQRRAVTEPGPQTGTEQFWAEWQPCSVSSTPDSWGALIRACGWNCTGMHADDGPAEETGITLCDADTLLALPLSSVAHSICLSLESQKSKCSHKEQL